MTTEKIEELRQAKLDARKNFCDYSDAHPKPTKAQKAELAELQNKVVLAQQAFNKEYMSEVVKNKDK